MFLNIEKIGSYLLLRWNFQNFHPSLREMKQNSRKFSVCSKIKRQFFYNHWKFRKLLPHPSDEILPTEIDFAGVDFLRLATHWQVWHRVRQTKLYCCFKQCFTVSHANWKRSSFKLKHCSSGVWSNWKCWIQLDLAGSSWSPATRIGYGTLPVPQDILFLRPNYDSCSKQWVE